MGYATLNRKRYPVFKNPQLASGLDQITGLVSESRFFRLARPVEVEEERVGSYYAHFAPELDLRSHGESREESWNNFIALFESDWNVIAQASDSKLTPGARKLKKTMLRLVEAVDTVR